MQLQPLATISTLLETHSNRYLDNVLFHLIFCILAEHHHDKKVVESNILLAITKILLRSNSKLVFSLLMDILPLDNQFEAKYNPKLEILAGTEALSTIISRVHCKSSMKLLILLCLNAQSYLDRNPELTAVFFCFLKLLIN